MLAVESLKERIRGKEWSDSEDEWSDSEDEGKDSIE
jgi:hypothetical protein